MERDVRRNGSGRHARSDASPGLRRATFRRAFFYNHKITVFLKRQRQTMDVRAPRPEAQRITLFLGPMD